jgi:acyl dehydratase
MTREWQSGDRLAPVSVELTLRRAIQAVGATRDYYPAHHDEQFAQESGASGLFFNTMFLQGFVGRAVNEWFGNDAFLRRLEIAMRAPNYVGRTLNAEGSVTAARESNGCRLIDAEVTLATEDGPTTDVRLTVQLPVSVTPFAAGGHRREP